MRARGEKALAAYHRAIESGGSTYDKRVKVLLVGQDRVGKTSLGKHTTVFDHKVAAKTAGDLLSKRSEQPAKKGPRTEASNKTDQFFVEASKRPKHFLLIYVSSQG